MFIDRIDDLASMEERWGLRPQLYLLWGRRRVGKSALIREFARGKDAIIFQALTGTVTDQLSLLTRRILAWRNDPVLAVRPLASWAETFAWLEMLGRERRDQGAPLLLVLDEFQYLDESDPTVISRLQEFLEVVRHEDLPLFIVVAGSAISFFEERILLGRLFGRRTGGGLLAPLGYREAAQFFPGWSPVDRIRAWGVLGGMPYYLEQLDPARSLARNIRERILTRNTVLYNEIDLLLRDELRDAPTYQSVLSGIAGGARKLSEIASSVGLPVTSLTPILRRLERLHLVERTVPVTEDPTKSRRGRWDLADNFVSFWFRFVRPNQVDLEAGRVAAVWSEDVAPNLDAHISRPAFERLCRAYIRSRMGVDPRLPSRGDTGAWWGPTTEATQEGTRTIQRECEVVVVRGGRVVLAGEAKWSRGLVGREALAQLRRTVTAIPGADRETRLVLFAREGFTDEVRSDAGEGLILVSAAEMHEAPDGLDEDEAMRLAVEETRAVRAERAASTRVHPRRP